MKFVRKLNLFDATMIVISGIIGSGIFINPYLVAQKVQTPFLILAVWVAGGLIALAGAFVFAELSTVMPKVGGQYAFFREAFHPLVAFLHGWSLLLIIQSGATAGVGLLRRSRADHVLLRRVAEPELRRRGGSRPAAQSAARGPARRFVRDRGLRGSERGLCSHAHGAGARGDQNSGGRRGGEAGRAVRSASDQLSGRHLDFRLYESGSTLRAASLLCNGRRRRFLQIARQTQSALSCADCGNTAARRVGLALRHLEPVRRTGRVRGLRRLDILRVGRDRADRLSPYNA